MNDAVIFQHVYSSSMYRHCIRLTWQRHFDYCFRHAMDFNFVESDVGGWPPDEGHWAKVTLLRQLTRSQYRYVFYIDADAMIWDLSIDLRAAFDGSTAAVLAARHPGPPVHLNTGVLFFESGDERLSEFFDQWIYERPGKPPWREQGHFNLLAQLPEFAGLVQVMDDRWNSTAGIAEATAPVIRAWHGNGDVFHRIHAMHEESKKWQR